jgi:hypothetical protein
VRVLIEPGVEVYPYTLLYFGDEITWPVIPEGWTDAGIDIPDQIAARWREARENWLIAQREAEAYLPEGWDR